MSNSSAFNEKDIYKFIEAVHADESLWNVQSCNYKDVFIRKSKWEELAKNFGLTGDEAKLKFKGLREKYRRHKELMESDRRKRSSNKKVWPLFRHLQFLDISYKKRKNMVKYYTDLLENNESLEFDFEETNDSHAVESDQSEHLGDPLTFESPSKITADVNGDCDTEEMVQPSSLALENEHGNFMEILNELVANINTAPPISQLSSVMHFLSETLDELNAKDKKSMEKELMTVAMRYRFKNE